jgi:DNA-binding response OmpR family regulator
MLDSAVRHAAVLLIGTDERTLRIIAWLLLEAGYDLAKVSTPDEAVGQTRTLNPAIIVLDGPAAAQRDGDAASLRQTFPHARLVGLHTHDDPNAHINAEGHLHKPFHADDLLDLVHSLLTVEVGSTSAHLHE